MATESTNQANEKVTFSEEQQAKVNELIKEAQGRAAREAKTELESIKQQFTALQTELVQAQEAVKKAGNKQQKSEAQDDVEALKARMAEIMEAGKASQQQIEALKKQVAAKDQEVNQSKESIRQINKKTEMLRAAEKCGFVDTSAALLLTSESIKWDDTRNKFIVVNETGTERMNSAFEPMSLDEFYTEYASKNPWMVRGDFKGGSGSHESQRSGLSNNGKYAVEDIFGPKSNAAKAQQLKRENPVEYKRLKEVARQNGLA